MLPLVMNLFGTVIAIQKVVYILTYIKIHWCDSTHTLNLTINNTDSTFSIVTSCDDFIWDGDTYTEVVHMQTF